MTAPSLLALCGSLVLRGYPECRQTISIVCRRTAAIVEFDHGGAANPTLRTVITILQREPDTTADQRRGVDSREARFGVGWRRRCSRRYVAGSCGRLRQFCINLNSKRPPRADAHGVSIRGQLPRI